MTEHEQTDDIERLLREMQPPSVPDETASASRELVEELRTWSRFYAVSMLAGLMTDPNLHANDIRIDWLQRLVLSRSTGKRKPKPQQISQVLNQGLVEARVHRLEDPIEDLFCDLISTSQGSYRIFLGRWEAAVPYTQSVYDAFRSLPDSATKRDALDVVHALLKLSDVLAERSSVDRGTPSQGDPMGEINLPSKDRIESLSRRVRFRIDALDGLGIDADALACFILEDEHLPYVSDREIGDTPLEFHPLISDGKWITIAAPANISTAVRAVMIGAAISGGMDRPMLRALMEQQERFSEATGFWPGSHIRLSPPNKHGMRASVCQYDHGQYLHIIQVPVLFDGFPQAGFASFRRLPEEASKFIAEDIERFWRFAEQHGDCRHTSTVLLLSGWGAPHGVAPPIDESKVPNHWQFLPLSFADAAVLGACDNGKFKDILLLLRQQDRLEKEGFSMMNPNGLLNLFGFWRGTGGNLIPEHMWEMNPPCNIVIDVGEILDPRLEGITRQDQRALPWPNGDYKIVQRKDWRKNDLKPIYASVDDLRDGRLSGAISIAGRTWWIESEARPGEKRNWRYQIWNAVIEWVAVVGPRLIEKHPKLFPLGAYRVSIDLPVDASFPNEGISADETVAQALTETVTCKPHLSVERMASVEVQAGWPSYLRSPKNDAEVELVAAVLEGFVEPRNTKASRGNIVQHVLDAIGSTDWRWLHAQEAIEPLQRLAGQGLIDDFKPNSFSAHALVKCGSVWTFRDRADGGEIEGEDACREFLASYRDNMLASLIDDIRHFDRRQLVEVAARSYQAGRHEQYRWRSTIRALRAIKGSAADSDAFARQNEINGVQRASKGICELAACEAAKGGGLAPSRAEIDEMFAKALLLFGNGQLFSAIRGGLIAPKLRISPAGDVLSEREVFSKLLEPGAAWIHSRALNDADQRYGKRRKEDAEVASEKVGWDPNFRAAVEAEYNTTAEAYVDLQFVLLQLAESHRQGVFFAKHSELRAALRDNEAYPREDISGLLRRLTLKCRSSWDADLAESDRDMSRFDRPFSLINRPLLAIDADDDPTVLVSPAFVSDAMMYAIGGLRSGELQGNYWESALARSHAGAMAKAEGELFEKTVEARLKALGLDAQMRCKLSKLLNEKVDPQFGDIDVFAVAKHKKTVWVIEAKNLRLCRTEGEVAARLSEYRGRMVVDSKGREKPDKLLRHVRRVQYLRERRAALAKNLKLDQWPEVRGLLIVDAPQPMNFHMLDEIPDAESAFLDAVDSFAF